MGPRGLHEVELHVSAHSTVCVMERMMKMVGGNRVLIIAISLGGTDFEFWLGFMS